MHKVFDQLIKLLSEGVLSPGGVVEREVEVVPDAMRVDLWFAPDAGRAAEALSPFGMLGRIALPGCTIEAFHRAPSGEEVLDCLVKHRHFCRMLRRRKGRLPFPWLWILAGGRPVTALEGCAFQRSAVEPGTYEAPGLWLARLVVAERAPAHPGHAAIAPRRRRRHPEGRHRGSCGAAA